MIAKTHHPSAMMNVLLVDDEAGNRSYLRDLLGELNAGIEIIGEASDIHQAERLILEHEPDIVFLDVEMPGGTGFDLLRKLERWDFEVIFVTGFQKYAIQAIRFSALDYLPKPVQPDELVQAIERYHQRHKDHDVRGMVQEQFITNIAQPDQTLFKLTLTSGDRSFFVPPTDVTMCIADRNYTEVRLQNDKRFLQARTLGDFEEMLLPFGFIRLNRSALVNRAGIDHVDGGEAVLKNGERIEVARRRKDEVMRALAS